MTRLSVFLAVEPDIGSGCIGHEGEPIVRNLFLLIRAFEQDTDKKQHLIQFGPDHSIEGLDKAGAAEAHSDILKTYGVPRDRRL